MNILEDSLYTQQALKKSIPEMILWGCHNSINIYYDPNKYYPVVEYGNDYLGIHDYLIKTKSNQHNVIARSNTSCLILRNENLYYKNQNLHLEVLLESGAYTHTMEFNRRTIYWLKANHDIEELMNEHKVFFTIDRQFVMKVDSDFDFFKSTQRIHRSHTPDYIKYFHEKFPCKR